MWLRLLALVVVGTSAISTPLQAQTRLDFTPHLGMYFPIKPVVDETGDQLWRQVTAVVLGGRLAFEKSRRILFETTLDYSPSPVAVTQNGRTVDNSAGMLLASARAVLRLGQAKPKTPEMQLSAGLGVINRFGSAWRNRTGTTDLAGVVGIAGRYPLGRDLPINVRIEIEDYISRAQFTATAGGRTSARPNHDTLWSVGFEIPMNDPVRK